MSNHLAVATVTEILKQRLHEVVIADVPGASATALRPNPDGGTSNGLPNPGVNIYLYQITPNAALRNSDLPTRRQDGSVSQRPLAAIDLHYLMSFYGDDDTQEPQRVLGSVVRTVHAQPVLTRDIIRRTIEALVQGNPDHFLKDSDLADQMELVRVTPQTLSTEELSKLWSVFFQTPYRLSIAYQASVVLIEGRESPVPALPVLERRIHVLTFRQPFIQGVEPQMVVSAPGARLNIGGRNLAADRVSIRFGAVAVTPNQPPTNARLSVEVPDGLRAGVNTIQVVHQREMGTPASARTSAESNVAAFILRPRITTGSPMNAAQGATLTLVCEPPVGRTQRVAILVGEREIAIPSRPASGPETTSTLIFPIPADVPVGNYLLRLRVDGAESALETDAGTGAYNAPIVVITV